MKPLTIATRALLLLAGLLSAPAVMAERSAVAETNANIYIGHSEIDNQQNSKLDYLGGNLNLPLGTLFGLGLDVLGARFDDDNLGEVDASSLHASLFARDPAKGYVGADYGRSRTRVDGPDLNIGETTVYAGVYLHRFGIGARRQKIRDLDSGERQDTSSIGGSVHPTDNLYLSADYSFMDDDGDTAITLGYQPTWLGSRVMIALDYTRRENSQEETETGAAVVLNYFFGPGKTLLRRMREDLRPF